MNGQAATCTTDGWKEYYQCSCGHVYTDQECTNEITNLVAWKAGDGKIAASHTLGDPIAAVEANCTDKGMKQHRECSVCGTLFDMDGNVKTAEELSIATNGTHAFGDWTSNGDGTHTRGCSHNNEHTETDNCAGGSATCTEKAICSTCNTAYGQADGHDYSEATCVAKAKCSVPTAKGVGADIVGEKTPTDNSIWKFVKRNDATFDIINAAEKSYIGRVEIFSSLPKRPDIDKYPLIPSRLLGISIGSNLVE